MFLTSRKFFGKKKLWVFQKSKKLIDTLLLDRDCAYIHVDLRSFVFIHIRRGLSEALRRHVSTSC